MYFLFLLILYFHYLKPETQLADQSGSTAFMVSVVNLCRVSRNDWYRVYLIRKIFSQHGVEMVLKLLKMDQMHWLFPEEVQQKVQLCIMRIFSLIAKYI